MITASASPRILAPFSGSVLLESTESIAARDGEASVSGIFRFHANLSNPFQLDANTTYWVGMSGVSLQLGQDFIADEPPFGDGGTAQFQDTTFEFIQFQFGDQAFRLHGRPVPEPSTLALITILLATVPLRRRAAHA